MPTFSQIGFVLHDFTNVEEICKENGSTFEHEGEFGTPESDIHAKQFSHIKKNHGGIIFDIRGTIRPEIYALAERIERGNEIQKFKEFIDYLLLDKTKP